MNSDSLAALMQALASDPIENDDIYAYLWNVDVALLQNHVDDFKKIEAEIKPAELTGKEAKQWTSSKISRKGLAFEKILRTLLVPGGRCFSSWERLQTDTNELDFLVQLEPLANLVRAFKNWGTHFICECKSTEAFTNTWLEKLYAVLKMKNASVGVVMSRKRPSKVGNGARSHATIVKIALLGQTLITVDLEDAEECVNGANFLVLLKNRYVETQTGVDKLRMIAGV